MKPSKIFLVATFISVSTAYPFAAVNTGRSVENIDAAANMTARIMNAQAVEFRKLIQKRSDSDVKDTAMSLLQPLGLPDYMMTLLKSVPDELLQKIMSLPPDKLEVIVSDLKAGKFPQVDGIPPKDLIVQVLPGLGAPEATVNMVKGLPDSAIQTLTNLSGAQLQQAVADLKQGKMPAVLSAAAAAPTSK
ncbi:hypothetical protein AA313_de0208586 [Arthrobotrys entomopaga]|nr:hypothetical protein AA313_de0208586 [Arthrobotrys entomopaga]